MAALSAGLLPAEAARASFTDVPSLRLGGAAADAMLLYSKGQGIVDQTRISSQAPKGISDDACMGIRVIRSAPGSLATPVP